MTHEYEAVVVGAGLYAALESSISAKTAVISKLYPMRSHTGAAQGGISGNRSVDDYLHLDATHLGKELIEVKLPDIADFCRTYKGIDPAEDPIPVQPTAHYAMGGIPTTK